MLAHDERSSIVARLLDLPIFIDTCKKAFSFSQLHPLISTASLPAAQQLEFGGSVPLLHQVKKWNVCPSSAAHVVASGERLDGISITAS
jgi:hypothetical protein